MKYQVCDHQYLDAKLSSCSSGIILHSNGKMLLESPRSLWAPILRLPLSTTRLLTMLQKSPRISSTADIAAEFAVSHDLNVLTTGGIIAEVYWEFG
jgi:hypothetical protein